MKVSKYSWSIHIKKRNKNKVVVSILFEFLGVYYVEGIVLRYSDLSILSELFAKT